MEPRYDRSYFRDGGVFVPVIRDGVPECDRVAVDQDGLVQWESTDGWIID
jgi:hypothetical protein